jgi:hypothetical protein
MKSGNPIARLLACVIIILAAKLNGQTCGSCSVVITGTSSTSYTVGSGQTLCIDTSGIYMGNITLSGGTICNRGHFKPTSFSFNSGTLNNYASSSISGTLSIGSGKTVYCERKSFLRVSGDLSISGGSLNNKGIANVRNNVACASGALNNSGIVNCKVFTASAGTYTNTGIINKD